MDRLSILPTELIARAFYYLHVLDDRLNFRATSRVRERIATLTIFREISFDLEVGGCDRISAIAGNPELQRHVRVIRLERRKGIKHFASFEDWCDANIHQYEPLGTTRTPAPPPEPSALPSEDAMAADKWESLDDDSETSLYRQYEEDERSLWA